METPAQNKYKKIDVTGTPTVELVKPTEYNKYIFDEKTVILILGPTGAGKSTFIEAIASNTSLGISSNRLEGFTQSISAYQLSNVGRTEKYNVYPIYLVDVPGFSDTKISEMKILSMLKDWREKTGLPYFSRILYFIPINTPRLPRSQRDVIRIFQALTGIRTAEGITVVTTMWDCLGSRTAKQRGERNFDQLRDQDYIGKKAEILKFHNTQESALSILDHSFQRFSYPDFALRSFLDSKVHLGETSYAADIYNGLHTRLQSLHIELANIQSDLLKAGEQGDEQLTGILVRQQEEAQKLLAMFDHELREFGDRPDSELVMGTPQHPNQANGLSSHPDIETPDITSSTVLPHAEGAPLSVITTSPIDRHSKLVGAVSLSYSHPESVVIATDSINEPADSHAQQIDSTIASPRTEESPFHVISTSPKDLSTAFPTDVAHAPAAPRSPTSIVQLNPSRMLMLKGLLRRLIQAAKRRGKKWFRKTTD